VTVSHLHAPVSYLNDTSVQRAVNIPVILEYRVLECRGKITYEAIVARYLVASCNRMGPDSFLHIA
jgi:hypothetical protein